MKGSNLILLVVLLIAVSASPVSAQNKARKIDSLLKGLAAEGRIHGSFLVAEKGKVIYSKGFGYTGSNQEGEQLGEHSVFELASVSKQFTAMAIMKLKTAGKLKYDDKLVHYLPQLSAYGDITIRQLLNHTAGLPDAFLLSDTVLDKTRTITNGDIVRAFARHQPPLLFTPGTRWEYSNAGYVLLASVVEKVSGMSFQRYLQGQIFLPLGMSQSFVHTERYAPRNIPSYAHGYVYSQTLKKYVSADADSSSGKMLWSNAIKGPARVQSTTGDLFKWDRALYTGKLVPQSELRAAFTAPGIMERPMDQYGFGWFVEEFPALGKIVNHGGSLPGYRTFIDRHIDSDRTIIVLQNHDDAFIPLQPLRAILAGQRLLDTAAAIPMHDSIIRQYAGVYIAGGTFRSIIKRQGAYYFFADGVYCRMYFTDNTRFFNTEFPSEKEIMKDEQGKVNGYRLSYFGSEQQRAAKVMNPDTLMAAEQLFNEVGWHFLEDKDYTQAQRYLERGLQLYPTSLIIAVNLAHCHLFNGRYSEAITFYRQHLHELVIPGTTTAEMVKQDFAFFSDNRFDSILMKKALDELNLH